MIYDDNFKYVLVKRKQLQFLQLLHRPICFDFFSNAARALAFQVQRNCNFRKVCARIPKMTELPVTGACKLQGLVLNSGGE